MTRAYSLAFKQKMIERLTGKDAVSANQLSKETGVRQQNLSRWPIHEAICRSLKWPAPRSPSGPIPGCKGWLAHFTGMSLDRRSDG